MATTRQRSDEPLASPFTVLVDSREQRPYAFDGLRADARQQCRPLVVATEIVTIRQGDYSLKGWTDHIAVERKSLADLYSTLGQGRDRFVRELERLASIEWAAVVVEAGWDEILAGAPRSQLDPKTVFRSVIAWQQRYPSIHWWTLPGRALAEVTTYRILERWWRDHEATEGKPDDA